PAESPAARAETDREEVTPRQAAIVSLTRQRGHRLAACFTLEPRPGILRSRGKALAGASG
ncbi:MAG TPA: hypothetical protein VHR72_08135, partial [Gemmataceae bacterium]|nr:hypothetical protein [Gemmataceae bacterium]